jgi:putative phosphoesterase
MKIAIISDTHDHLDNLKKALDKVNALGADALLFCGDFCAPGPARLMIKMFTGTMHTVFGNNDGDRMNINMFLSEAPNATVHKEYADIVLDGKRVGMTHYPFYADKMAKSGDFDLVCFGHDHKARIETYGDCLAINPGALNHLRPDDNVGFALYDTQTHTATLYPLD